MRIGSLDHKSCYEYVGTGMQHGPYYHFIGSGGFCPDSACQCSYRGEACRIAVPAVWFIRAEGSLVCQLPFDPAF